MMTTMVLERTALPTFISNLFRSPRLKIWQRHNGEVVISPVSDRAEKSDRANSDDLLNALNAVYSNVDSRLDEDLAHAQFLTIEEDW